MAGSQHGDLLVTGDASHTLVSDRFGVPYHSRHGAVQESVHVFLESGVLPLLEAGRRHLDILEMGFGTGLNALLLYRLSREWPAVTFTYVAIERYPLDPAAVRALNYPELLGVEAATFHRLHTVVPDEPTPLSDNLIFTLRVEDFLNPMEIEEGRRSAGAVLQEGFDVIFYDAFAPVSQPELWAVPAFQQCFNYLRPDGRLVTYCAKGQVKRDLRSVGFRVEPLIGPPGKREMTRAVRPLP